LSTQLGQRFSAAGPLITIGREPGNDIVVNDPEVSRRHFSLTWDGRRYIIQDLGTANGTFVNGARLTATQALQSGDVIGLGATMALTFQTIAPAAAADTAIRAVKRGGKGKGWAALPLLAIALAVCGLLAVAAAAGYYFLRPKAAGLPLVLIDSPRHGEQVEVGREMTIHAVARDAGKVARVELWIDGQLHQAQDSSLPGGTSPFPLLVRWQPTSAGNHTLTARAINTQGGRAQAAISVQAVQGTDRDGDSVDDSVDACPDQRGGWVDNGCPQEEMSDPNEDLDGDGVLGADDACPNQAGPAAAQGCPDADGDGVPDDRDLSPGEAGPAEGGGVPGGGPGGGAADRDGDGVPDSADRCPDEAGRSEDDGCPPPDVSESGDGGSGLGPPGDMSAEMMVPVEFEALAFTVDREYSYVHCYASLAGGDQERFEFEPLGERQWDIVARLGGENSRTVLVAPEGPLEVRADCGGEVVFHLGPGEEEGSYFPLGTAIMSHFPAEWDGRELTARGEVEGHWFEARYRLCAGSCENATLPAPILDLTDVGVPGREPSMRFLTWHWSGDRDTITGFKLYADGNFSRSPARERNSFELQGGLLPACGERLEFQLTTYSGATLTPERESPRSNIVVVEAPPCLHRTVRVTFDRLLTGNLQDGDPNRNWDEHRLGPIFGGFWAQGSNEVDLNFDGSDGFLHGLMLDSNTERSVQSLFDWIWGELSILCGEPGCPPYYAPESSTVTVELGPDDDLTFGGVIYEWDYGVYYEAFNQSRTIPADDIQDVRPNIYYTLNDGPIALRVSLEVVSSYEVGGTKPDLTVTAVTNHEPSGQLRIHVRNTNASMANQTVAVALARIATNELIGTYTWENVTIAAGEERILQTDFPIEASGLRVILDPDNRIDETNERNNIYETP
jgi:hypothetical protein